MLRPPFLLTTTFMKKSLFFSFLLALFFFRDMAAASEATPSLELHWSGKPTPLSEPASHQLLDQAMKLVQSSNFHSDPGDKYHFFQLPQVQSSYRQEVAGRYLLVTLPESQSIQTIGGRIEVREIVIGLNRDDYASNLFTIDSTGRIVGHAKYAGEVCRQIFSTIEQALR
ncbi:MAG: hypothetical protein QM796_22175 [Chthoniobacteraceae bacterium]